MKAVLQDASEEGALDHYEAADLTIPVAAVNHLQRQRLLCSGAMVRVQRVTWEGGWQDCGRATGSARNTGAFER